jgi:hypothetical protein
MDDLGSGALAFLAQFPSVTDAISAFPPGDPNAGAPIMFKGHSGAYRGIPYTIQSTSLAGLVLSPWGAYSVAPPLTTPRKLRLAVEIFMDPLRDGALQVTETQASTEKRWHGVFNAVHQALQFTDPDSVLWGDIVVTACGIMSEPMPDILKGGDGDGLLYGMAVYGVDTFGYSDVQTG